MNEHYYIKNKDFDKHAFDYYLISQVDSELDTEYIIENKDKEIKEIETVMLYANSINQGRKEYPSIFKNFERWTFPKGLKVIQENDPRFKMLSDFYRDPSAKLGSHIHEINYFVVTDMETLEKYYCTSAFFYEKIVIIDKVQRVHQFFIPRCHIIMSSAPLYCAQKNLIGILLHVHRIKQNSEQDKIIQVNYEDRIYGIEQSKLFEYYIQFTYEKCLLSEENEKVQLRFHTADKQLVYYTKNDISNTFYSIANPSNVFFDSLIFGQSPFNLLQLVTYLTLEYQLILVSKRTNSLPLFAENLLELIRPLFWRGVYIPNLMQLNSFDYKNSKIPYIIGINKKDYTPPTKEEEANNAKNQFKRAVYDVDENTFIYVFEGQKLSQPASYKNYFLTKINLIIGDIKFYEEEYNNQAILRYKQFFYNFILLTFHEMVGFLSKNNNTLNKSHISNNETPTNKDAHAQTAASSYCVMKSSNLLDQGQSVLSGNASTVQQNTKQINFNTKKDIHHQDAPSNKKIVYFNYQSYIASADEQDQPFYTLATKTIILNALIKDCFRAIDHRDEFIEQSRQKQFEYTFGSIFCFINDSAFLNNRGPDISLYERIKQLEDIQHKVIAEQLLGSNNKEKIINADDGVAEYLENLFNSNGKKESYDREASSNAFSSFLNNPLDWQKELKRTSSSQFTQTKKLFTNTFNQSTGEMFREDSHPMFLTKEQFNKQFHDEKRKKKDQQNDNITHTHGENYSRSHSHFNSHSHTLGGRTKSGVATQYTKHFSEFNEELWQISSQMNEDIQADQNRQALSNNMNKETYNSLTIRQLVLLDKKDLFSKYQQLDEEEVDFGKYYRGGDGLSTVLEVQSAYSNAQPQKYTRRGSLKEFNKHGTGHGNELNINTMPGFSKQGSSLFAQGEDPLSCVGADKSSSNQILKSQ